MNSVEAHCSLVLVSYTKTLELLTVRLLRKCKHISPNLVQLPGLLCNAWLQLSMHPYGEKLMLYPPRRELSNMEEDTSSKP